MIIDGLRFPILEWTSKTWHNFLEALSSMKSEKLIIEEEVLENARRLEESASVQEIANLLVKLVLETPITFVEFSRKRQE